jgi:hypothetical protein
MYRLCWNRTADHLHTRHTPTHTQAVGSRHTHSNAQHRVLGLFGQHSPPPKKASTFGECTLNHINHVCPPTTHNVGLFPTISPSHIVSRDLSKNALDRPKPQYQLLEPNRRHTACPVGRLHTRLTREHTPEHTAAGFRSVGQHPPQKKTSPLGVCTLKHINHACPPITYNVGLFPTIYSSHTKGIMQVHLLSSNNWPPILRILRVQVC